MKKGWAPFATLAALALGLRLYFWRIKFLNIDEAFELFIAGQPSLRNLVRMMLASFPQQSLANYLFHHAILSLTHSVSLARLPGLTLGVLSVLVVFAVAAELEKDAALGWFWAGLLCVSMHHINYSIVFRPYSLIAFLSVLQLLIFARLSQGKGSLAAFGLALALFQLSYQFAFSMGLVELAALAWEAPRLRRPAAAWALAILLVPAAWLLFFGRGLFSTPMFSFGAAFVFGPRALWQVLFQWGQHDGAAALGYAALFVVGLAVSLAKRTSSQGRTFAAALACLFATAMLSMARAHLFLDPRHLIAGYPLYLYFVAVGALSVCSAASRLMPRPLALGLLAAFFAQRTLVSFAAYARFLGGMQRELERSASLLRKEIRPGDQIVASNPNYGATFAYYYDPESLFRLKEVSLAQGVNFFAFPDDLRLFNGQSENAFYTLNPLAPGSATLSKSGLARLLAQDRKSGNRLWLVHLPANYVPLPRPFDTLFPGDGRGPALEAVGPGLFSAAPAAAFSP